MGDKGACGVQMSDWTTLRIDSIRAKVWFGARADMDFYKKFENRFVEATSPCRPPGADAPTLRA